MTEPHSSYPTTKLVYEITMDRKNATYILNKIRYDVDKIEFKRKFQSSPTTVNESLSEPEEGFEEHCFCNRGLRNTPNKKKYCSMHGYEYHSSTPKTKEVDEVEAYKDRHGRYLGVEES